MTLQRAKDIKQTALRQHQHQHQQDMQEGCVYG